MNKKIKEKKITVDGLAIMIEKESRRINSHIDEIEGRLNGKITKVEKEIKDEIMRVEGELIKEIKNVDTRKKVANLQVRVTNLETKVDLSAGKL